MNEHKKVYLIAIALIALQTIMILIGEQDPQYGIPCIVFFGVLALITRFSKTKKYKRWFIKNWCPTIYNNYFKNDNSNSLWNSTFYKDSQNKYLSMSIDELNLEESFLRTHNVFENEYKENLAKLLNEKQDEDWYRRAIYFLKKNKHKMPFSTEYEILVPELKDTLFYASDIYKLAKAVKLYEKNRLQLNMQAVKSTKESEDDITREDIITKEIEFTEHGIYTNKKVWDGVKYTMKKQRVFVYKRCYHLDMGEPPRFHICRCSTMNNYIFANSLEIEYRKSSKAKVKVKNMDRNYIENEIGHLPLCGNCYKIMKKQFSWLDSKMDNEDFIKNVINKVQWSDNY